ncbi:MAG: primosomal protein N' [Candidatus Ornithospirochaeta sp.]
MTVVLSVPFEGEFTYSVPEGMEDAAKFGHRAMVPFGSAKKTAFIVSESYEEPKGDYDVKPISRVVDKEAVFNKDLLDMARWMQGMYLSPVGVNLGMMIPSGRRESEASPFFQLSSFSPVEKLTEEQSAALSRISSFPKETFYVYGVTGSGKSEVYLRRAEEVIREGRQVLYMVPEITLSHQISGEVYGRFGGRVAILHSALTPSQRLKAWREIMKGDVDLVVGARSSVFAPFKDLGLIIIDEEHEGAYKSGSSPRYHARQVAQYRAAKSKAQLLMGSATPSLEAWNLMKTQRIKSVVMRNRIGEARFPKVSIVNMIGEKRNISARLEEEIRSCLKEKKGVILFLNRRGFTYGYQCSSCGYTFQCPNCSVAMTYHKGRGRIACHLCGYSSPLSRVCPECGSTDIAPRGYGTENVEEEARALFPFARIERLDTDVTGGDSEKTREILESFRKGDVDILLGTQMIAKGLNFPKVSLVGILNADSSLSMPDFRAGERTFDILLQVAGRAGRYRDDGVVIIQTRQPNAPAIALAARNEQERFYEVELSSRRETMFPPFTRLVNLTIRGKDEEKTKAAAEALGAIADKEAEDNDEIEVFSASPSLVEKMAGQWRWHVLLRSGSISALLSFAHRLLSTFRLPSSLHLEVDVDPLNLM